MHTVQVPDTSRCVSAYQQDDEVMVIAADQLSDVMVLQKENVSPPGQCHLKVFINRVPNQDADGMSVNGRTQGWHQALMYLLETSQPSVVYINVVKEESSIEDDKFFMTLEDGSLYWSEWIEDGTILAVIRSVGLISTFLLSVCYQYRIITYRC